MLISNTYILEDVIVELEGVFCIDGSDYTTKDMDIFIKNIRQRISRQTAIDLISYNLDNEALALSSASKRLLVYVDNLARVYSKLTALGHVYRFTTDCPISLREHNFIGFTEESVKTILRVLMLKSTMPKARDAIETLKDRMSSISNSVVKRLFMLMILTFEMGAWEISSAIAEILYLGGRE